MIDLKTLCRLAIFVILGISAGCASENSRPGSSGQSTDAERLQKLAGNQLELIRSPDSVAIQRIETSPEGEKTLTDLQPLTDPQLKVLQALLLDEDSYGWDYSKGCVPTPGILIVFSKGSAQLEVRLCYECLMAGFLPGSWGNFDPIESELTSWAKTVFPNDEVFAAMNAGGAR